MFPVPSPVRRQPCARRLPVSVILLANSWVSVALGAQQLPAGLVASQANLPAMTSLVLKTTAGTVLFDGTTVSLVPPSQPPQILLQLPSFAFGSFLLQTDPAHVLFGHTGTPHEVWLLPLQGPAPTQPLALIAFNYDAAMLDASRVLVSARTGGFSAPDNELWVTDLPTGNTQLLATVPGASGPVAVAANGDVYYATGFAGLPMPPGTTRVLRFPRARVDAAIAAQRVLGLAHADIVMAGMDAASDMVFDDDDDLLFVDWFNGCIGEISDATSSQPNLVGTVIDYSQASVFPTTVQFLRGVQTGVFEPFQPTNGTLLVHETDYVAVNRARSVNARAALLTTTQPSPIPTGAFAFVATNGPPAGVGVLAFALGTSPGTFVLQVPGFEAPLHWSAALAGSPILLPLAFDGLGTATWTGLNPGFAPALAAVAQVAFVSVPGALGATSPLPLLIGQ